ncbi:MAG: DUF5615 family PIN-like protein [Beijerinckiaceae bacterium]
MLLDECLPRKLRRAFAGAGHEVKTVAECGWAGRKNGDLLRLAQEQFDAFITVDRNMAFQQDAGQIDTTVVVLKA